MNNYLMIEFIKNLQKKYKNYGYMKYKVEANEKNNCSGKNWLKASFGIGNDNKHYFLTTDCIHASENVGTAESDINLVCELLNFFCNTPRISINKKKIYRVLFDRLQYKIPKEISKEVTQNLVNQIVEHWDDFLCPDFCDEVKLRNKDNVLSHGNYNAGGDFDINDENDLE